MDREGLVRASRRRRALDALAFEQERAAVLVSVLEDVIAELDGPSLDAALFARMSADDAALVRVALGDNPEVDEDETDSVAAEDEEHAEDGVEEEIARLEGELEQSRSIQAALERYLALLADRPAE